MGSSPCFPSPSVTGPNPRFISYLIETNPFLASAPVEVEANASLLFKKKSKSTFPRKHEEGGKSTPLLPLQLQEGAITTPPLSLEEVANFLSQDHAHFPFPGRGLSLRLSSICRRGSWPCLSSIPRTEPCLVFTSGLGRPSPCLPSLPRTRPNPRLLSHVKMGTATVSYILLFDLVWIQ